MQEKIKLKRNPHGDSRHAPKDTTFEQFHEANISHIHDVQQVMNWLSTLVKNQGKIHDWTKIRYEKEFWDDFWSEDFVNGKWYQRHVHTEKHHPTAFCHDDVDLIDILEMIVDCVCAGKARSGEVRPIEINEEILKKAVDNTVKLIDKYTEVE
jgi:hypothetical protein